MKFSYTRDAQYKFFLQYYTCIINHILSISNTLINEENTDDQ